MTKLPPAIINSWPSWTDDIRRQVWDGLDASQRRQLARRHPTTTPTPAPRRMTFRPVSDIAQADFKDDYDEHETEPDWDDDEDDDPIDLASGFREIFGGLAQADDKPPPDGLGSVVEARLKVLAVSPETMANLYLEPPYRAHYGRDRERCLGDVLAVYWRLVEKGLIVWDGNITTQGEWK